MRFISRHICRAFPGENRMMSVFDEPADLASPIKVCPSCRERIVVSETYNDYSDLIKRVNPKFKRKK